jgi:hypothetical protein
MSPGCTAEGRRILTLMEIYEFQIARAFAKEIRVAQPRLSNVIAVGQPLPKELAFAIVARFPEMSLDFLWRGKKLRHLPWPPRTNVWRRRTSPRGWAQRPRSGIRTRCRLEPSLALSCTSPLIYCSVTLA